MNINTINTSTDTIIHRFARCLLLRVLLSNTSSLREEIREISTYSFFPFFILFPYDRVPSTNGSAEVEDLVLRLC